MRCAGVKLGPTLKSTFHVRESGERADLSTGRVDASTWV
jgi:hypothetical protein